MENKQEAFTFTYSAKQQEEISNIRKKYAAPEEDKMEQLRRLDRGVTAKANAVSLIVGIFGTLIMGIGMCCVLEWADTWLLPGVAIGIIGIIILSLAYPLYNAVLKKERERVAPEILRLTDELMR